MGSRRAWLEHTASLGWAALIGCNQDEKWNAGGHEAAEDAAIKPDARAPTPHEAQGPDCSDAAPWKRLGAIPFADALEVDFGKLRGEGWDARLYTDLTRLSEDALLTSNEEFYIRTDYPDTLEPGSLWDLELGGRVMSPRALSYDWLLERTKSQGVVLLECAGNHRSGGFGLMSAARFSGVSVEEVIAEVNPTPDATRLLFTGYDMHSVPSVGGHSTPGASWSFTPEELINADAFIATGMNGAALPLRHGFPFRLVVPGWYGCSAIKWLQSIVWERGDALATSQMQEFAGRTHQTGTPARASDYRPAVIEQAAMPIRLELVEDEHGKFVHVIGVAWGGAKALSSLSLSVDGGNQYEAVALCHAPSSDATWRLWSYVWEPPRNGLYALRCRAPTGVPMQRLDAGRYERSVTIDYL